MDLQITGLEEQDVVQAAAVKFPGKYIEMGESDLYLPDIEKGSLTIELTEPLPNRDVVVITNNHTPINSAARRFLEFLLENRK